MTDYLIPRIDILPEPQKKIWLELKNTPTDFVLYGGTALALRFGHRQSIDFDFFSNKTFDPDKLYKTIKYLNGSDIQQIDENTLTCYVEREGEVKISFFGGLDLGSIKFPSVVKENNLKIASPIDIGASKMRVILLRPSWKDYVDIDTLLQNSENLTNMLSAANSLYHGAYNPLLSLKALSCFDDIREPISDEVKKTILKSVAEVKLDNIKKLKINKTLTESKELSL